MTNSKPMLHADVIKHMADNGIASVQFRRDKMFPWRTVSSECNPITHSYLEWRIKPLPLCIDDYPLPEIGPPKRRAIYYVLFIDCAFRWEDAEMDLVYLQQKRVYLDRKSKDEAEHLLIAALDAYRPAC